MIEIYYKLKVFQHFFGLPSASGRAMTRALKDKMDRCMDRHVARSQGCSHDHMFVQLPTMTDQQHRSSMLAT